jgi:adenine-specific DNA-methyltransferase
MTDTRKMLLENFDEDVHERLKIQLHNAQVQLDKFSTYAIPYAGEEVVLHWANKDQYYTKSGENFSNYGFKLDDGRSVYFRLVAADTAKDNRKDNDKERRFVLIEADSRTVSDEDGEEYQQPLEPISEENGDLVLRFEYKAMPKGSKQDDLIAQALKNIFDHPVVKARWLGLTQRQPTEKNPQRSLLEKALNHYTAKNSTDYFMNKDLGGFLRRELDFYIKNEVMNLDDLQQAEKFADIEHKLRMIQTLRAIGLDVITFLAQLEDFQKKLWLKKKFIVAADYCITLDRIIKEAPALLDSIAANPKQWAQWQGLGLLHDKTDLLNLAEAGSVDYLKENPYLMVDSALFDAAFKQGLLAAIHDLDDSLDGLLVHGDNFQALHILQTRYSEKVSMSYIDPPYNTGLGDFSYKDKYLHSSWMSLIDQTTLVAHKLMSDKSVFWITLDDNEFHRAKLEIEQTSNLSFVSTVCWQKVYSPRMDAKQFSNSVDYLLAFSKSDNWIPKRMTIEPDLKQFALVDHNGRRYRSDPLRKWGKNSLRQDRPNLWYGIASPSGEVIFPIKPDGTEGYWRWKKEKVDSQYNELDWLDKGNGLQPYLRQYADNSTERPIETFWSFELAGSTHESSEEIKALFGDMAFPTPKPTKLIKLCIAPVDNKENIIIDYFAGSGTTGHAVISQNRNDNGNRFYILLEQGDYFDTVLKPRIQKVVYSADWKDGKATAPHTGISHAFKVLKIESYEDTLNNLALRRTPQQSSLLENLPESVQEDYLLRYLLEIESRGSLLSVEQFAKPFAVKLKVSVDSAGAYEERNVDLVETFNYLLGLHVKHIDMNLDKGFVLVTGLLPSGEKTLILWRDVEQVDYVALNRLCDKLAINPADSEYEVVYINGDHNIPAVFTSLENEGGITKVLKIRQIEPEFLSRMFDVETV